MAARSSRGGVPVFSRPHAKPNAFSDSASARRRLVGAPGRTLLRPDVNQAVQKRAGGDDQRRGSE